MPFAPLMLVHLAGAFLALGIGARLLMLQKGTPAHRTTGRLWVALMVMTSLSSFGIRSTGAFSVIHLLSVWTLFSVAMAMLSVYRHHIRSHRRWMTGTYIGLVMAGLFALLPQRRLGHLLWHGIGLL